MKNLFVVLLMLIPTLSNAQQKDIIYLWPGKVPGEMNEKKEAVYAAPENDNILRVAEVTNPLVEVWLPHPALSNGSAVIVCPGGGYGILAYNLEGTEITEWLNKLGYTAFLLQYRVPAKRDGALQDAQRALRIIRHNAANWKINPDQIGIMGFSAGGSLSARASTLFNKRTYLPVDEADSISCRPSFAMLIYPAYLDLGPGRTLTPELEISRDTPPIFLFQTADDQYGNSSLVMAGALRDAKIPVELHLLPSGGHGYGLREGKISGKTWPLLAEKWLQNTIHPKVNLSGN